MTTQLGILVVVVGVGYRGALREVSSKSHSRNRGKQHNHAGRRECRSSGARLSSETHHGNDNGRSLQRERKAHSRQKMRRKLNIMMTLPCATGVEWGKRRKMLLSNDYCCRSLPPLVITSSHCSPSSWYNQNAFFVVVNENEFPWLHQTFFFQPAPLSLLRWIFKP